MLPHQRTVRIELHPSRAGDRGQMNPFVGREQAIHPDMMHQRTIQSGILRIKIEAQVRGLVVIEQVHGLPGGSELENPGIGAEGVPLGPNFDCGFSEVGENIWRQFDVTPEAVEFQDFVFSRGEVASQQNPEDYGPEMAKRKLTWVIPAGWILEKTNSGRTIYTRTGRTLNWYHERRCTVCALTKSRLIFSDAKDFSPPGSARRWRVGFGGSPKPSCLRLCLLPRHSVQPRRAPRME